MHDDLYVGLTIFGLVDAEKIGVMGHSLGGAAAFSLHLGGAGHFSLTDLDTGSIAMVETDSSGITLYFRSYS